MPRWSRAKCRDITVPRQARSYPTSLARQGKTEEAAAARARFTKAWARADVAPTVSPLVASSVGGIGVVAR